MVCDGSLSCFLLRRKTSQNTTRSIHKTEKKKKSATATVTMRRKDDSSSSSYASCPPGAYAREAYFAKRTEKQLWPPPTLVVRDDVELDKETSSSHDSTLTTTTKGGGGGPPPPPPPALDVVERPMADLLGSRRGRRRRNDDDKMACKYVSEECLVEHASREEFLGDLMVEVHVVHREEKKGEDDDEKKDARKSVDKNVFAHVDLAGHRKPNTPRNFTFQKMTWREMIRRIRKGEKLYMRHTNGPKKPANVLKDFIDPETKRNPFDTPTFRERCSPDADENANLVHSSVLRVSSPGTTLWMHFDTRDNALHQLSGKKRVILYAPECEPYLNVEGSSARLKYVRGVENFDREILKELSDDDIQKYKLFDDIRLEHAYVCTLNPGEALWIPAFWFHRVTSLPSETNEPSVAVNVFYNDERLKPEDYDAKDVYGNKDLVVAKDAMKKASELGANLNSLPEPYKTFYARRCLNEIAAQLGMFLDIPLRSHRGNKYNLSKDAMKAFED
jgi:tRNA wybutosine-synthesizing protein 5